jgi:hypothetical protein
MFRRVNNMFRSVNRDVGGRYVGKLHTVWEVDGRHMRLLRPFCYIDPAGLDWPVPKDAMIDGASIPRAFWTLIGGPFEGLYRYGSVIHDYHCDVCVRPWQAVHRMFYDAMITSGVSEIQAKTMYFAVRLGGPRWNEQKTHNANIRRKSNNFIELRRCESVDMFSTVSNSFPDETMTVMEPAIEVESVVLGKFDPGASLEQVEAAADRERSMLATRTQ